jgi:hypothetical protein
MKCRIGLWLLLLTCTTAAQTRGPLDLANAQAPPGARRIAYGNELLQFGELRVPSTKGPHPVAIVVHGGCWVAKLGNLDERAVAIDNMRPLAAALTEAGIATWNIEYRRLGNAGGGWPGTFQDVGRAADFVRTLAASNALDLTRAIATIAVQQPICGSLVITNLMGGAPDQQPERYRAASPIELLPFGVRQEFFAGAMFATQAAPYEAATKRAGDTLHATVLPTAGHFVFIDPQSEVWLQVLAATRRLVSKPE